MKRPFSITLRLIVAAMLFWALARHPYDYYTLLRWVVCGSAAYFWFRAKELDIVAWQWIFGIMALMFNPLLPVHLSKEIWGVIDFVCGVVYIVSIFLLKKPKTSGVTAE